MCFEMRDGISEVERLDVYPGEVGCLDRRGDVHPWKLTSEEIEEEVAIAAQVREQVLAPRLAVAIGGFAGGEAQRGYFGDDASGGADKAGAQRGVRDDGERGAESGDVVGLAGCH